MTNLVETDEKLAVLVNLKQKWIEEGCPKNLRDYLKKEINSFPVKLEIHDFFLKNLKKEMETDREYSHLLKPVSLRSKKIKEDQIPKLPQDFWQGFPSKTAEILKSSLSTKVVIEERVVLPVRNHGTDIPGHVEVFKENNGLIHGGIIHKKNYDLVCKAYLYFFSQEFDDIDIVAGVCEQKNKEGKVINRWSTAQRLQNIYADISSLPIGQLAMVYDRVTQIMQGHYIPSDWIYHVLPNQGKCPDNGTPLAGVYNPTSPNHDFSFPPGYQTAVENALFNQLPTGGPGTPICTPYIKITAPHPDMKETIVQMVGVYRELHGVRPTLKFNRGGEYYIKTFQ